MDGLGHVALNRQGAISNVLVDDNIGVGLAAKACATSVEFQFGSLLGRKVIVKDGKMRSLYKSKYEQAYTEKRIYVP